jgi:hypothetical protein
MIQFLEDLTDRPLIFFEVCVWEMFGRVFCGPGLGLRGIELNPLKFETPQKAGPLLFGECQAERKLNAVLG